MSNSTLPRDFTLLQVLTVCICLPFFSTFVYVKPVYLSVSVYLCLFYACLSVCLCLSLSILCLSVCLSLFLSLPYGCIYLFIYRFFSLCLSPCLSYALLIFKAPPPPPHTHKSSSSLFYLISAHVFSPYHYFLNLSPTGDPQLSLSWLLIIRLAS